MRHINKNPKEPTELLEFRKNCKPNCDWDDFRDKDAVREKLLDDQTYICCYCMQRIDVQSMKIEHYLNRSDHQDMQLIWRNLFASCTGGEGKSKAQQTCDTRKANFDLSIDPLGLKDMEEIRYRPDGRVVHDKYQTDLDKILNLNSDVLMHRRRNALDGLKQALCNELGPKKAWPKSRLKRKLSDLQNASRGVPFLGLLEYWLNKRIQA